MAVQRIKISFKDKIQNTFGTLKTLLIHRKRIIDPSKTYYPECRHKSGITMAREHLRYCMKYGCRIHEYYLYGLDVVGTDPMDYITESFNMDCLAHVHSRVNPNYTITLIDKCLFAQIMHDANMPIPTTFGMVRNGQLRVQGDFSNSVPWERILQTDCHLLCKPIRGFSGNGIIPIKVESGVLYHKGNALSLEQFRTMLSGDTYLLQHFVENQHPAMKALFPKVLNTIRVTMARTEKGIELLGVMCLMGSANSEYSNWHFGGICISVDEEGKLRKYGFSNQDGRIVKHPDTGVVFEGYQLPYYKEMISLCTKAMDVFYGMKTIGWDMAVTEDGPIFIEGNHGWGIAAHQMVDHQSWGEKYRRALGLKW